MKHILWIVALLMLMSCTATRKASTEEVTDNYRSTEKLDSIFINAIQRDSIYLRDSIYVREKGDTVYKYIEKLRYKYVNSVDTLYRTIVRVDTAYVDRTKLEVHEKPVYIEKEIKWYNKCCIWLGRICCLAAILWAIFLYLKRKF